MIMEVPLMSRLNKGYSQARNMLQQIAMGSLVMLQMDLMQLVLIVLQHLNSIVLVMI